MERVDEIIGEYSQILKSLNKEDTSPKKITEESELRQNVMTFVSKQMETIQKQDVLRSIIEAELIKKVMLHELDTSELLETYKQISNEKSKNSDVLLSLFKPSNSAPSTLMLPPMREEENTTLDLSSQQRQAIEKLARFMELINKKEAENNEV